MLRKGFACWVFVLTVSTAVWSDEPLPPQKSVKQRVSPKLLREALALPEYQGKAATIPPPVSLDDLQRLAEKLKKGGDNEGADLLQRFVLEHQKPATQSFLHSTADNARIDIQMKFVEVNLDDVAADSIVFDKNPERKIQELQSELDRLIVAKKARTWTEPLFKSRVDKVAHYLESKDGANAVQSDAGKADDSDKLSDFTINIEIRATPVLKDRIRLHAAFEVSCRELDKSAVDANTGNGVVPGRELPQMRKRTGQGSIETQFGEWTLPINLPAEKGRKLFVMARVTPEN